MKFLLFGWYWIRSILPKSKGRRREKTMNSSAEQQQVREEKPIPHPFVEDRASQAVFRNEVIIPSSRGFLKTLAVTLGRALARVNVSMGAKPTAKRTELTKDALWESFLSDVEAAKVHPRVTLLDQYFLSPEKLSRETSKAIAEHLSHCKECQEAESDYRTHEAHFRLRKAEPCD